MYSSCRQPSTAQAVIKTWQGTSEPTCVCITPTKANSPICWEVLFIHSNGRRDAPLCELRMYTLPVYGPVNKGNANSACLFTFCRHLRHSPCSASAHHPTLTHLYMPSSNHRYQHTGGSVAFFRLSYHDYHSHEMLKQKCSHDLGKPTCTGRVPECKPHDSAWYDRGKM